MSPCCKYEDHQSETGSGNAPRYSFAGVAELVNAASFNLADPAGSCGFESHRPHHFILLVSH